MSKINKLGKSTFVIAILSFILVAVLAFGGTYAYFSASDSAVTGSVNTGILTMTLTDDKDVDKNVVTLSGTVVPNQQIMDETFTINVEGNIKYFVRATYSVKVTPATNAAGHKNGSDCVDNVTNDLDILNMGDTTTTNWTEAAVAKEVEGQGTQQVNTGVYYYVGTDGKVAALDPTAEGYTNLTYTVDAKVHAWVGQGECTHYQNAKIEITLSFEVIQADYLGNATAETTYTPAELHAAWEAALKVTKTGA